MANWAGKSTEELIGSIYKKIGELKNSYPHNKNNPKYRWNVRVKDIIKLIWLLLKHVCVGIKEKAEHLHDELM